jgi:hypothetical protein
MLTTNNRVGVWFAVCLGLVSGCAGADTEGAEDDALLGSASEPLCAAQPEFGSWYHQTFGSPHLIDLWGDNRCGTRAEIWELQAGGSLWQRGDFASQSELLEDGSRWRVVDAYPVGGYLAHPWLHFDKANDQLRVWIYYESLDSKPDAVEDHRYRREPPRVADDTFNPRGSLGLER